MSDPLIKNIKQGRKDLTDYVIHFTRGSEGLNPYEVLKKIVQDGYLKCGWSHRGSRRTIFGTKPAVCFSETPLCGFLDYAKKRNDNKISCYGFFLKKSQFFEAGGRPVIYGSTMAPEEKFNPDGSGYISCLDESEQYRYILTNIDEKNDWTHEREWRWANWRNHSVNEEIMPLWEIGQTEPWSNHNFKFCPLGIIVETKQQAEDIQQLLIKNYLLEVEDSKMQIEGEYGKESRLFSLNAIKCTAIIILDNFTDNEKQELTIEKIIEDNSHTIMNDILISNGVISD